MSINVCQESRLCAFIHPHFVNIVLSRESLADIALITIDGTSLAYVAKRAFQSRSTIHRCIMDTEYAAVSLTVDV